MKLPVVLALLLVATQAYADFPLSSYKDLKEVASFKSYMTGVGRGIFWANTVLEVNGQKPLFCMPEKLAADQGLILSLLDQEVRSRQQDPAADQSVTLELLLAKSFMARFPCQK